MSAPPGNASPGNTSPGSASPPNVSSPGVPPGSVPPAAVPSAAPPASAPPAAAPPASDPSASADAAERGSLRDWIAVASCMIGAFMAILDIQITNASLASIEGAIGASPSEGSWISTAYLMAEIVVIPVTGWLSRIVGLRRYLLVNTCLFILFSLLCANATTLDELILFRIGQGFTGGVMIPIALTVLRFRLPASQQPAGVAVFGFSLTFGPTLGPMLGGWLTDRFSWHALFTVNLPPGILAVVMLALTLDRAPSRLRELRDGDWLGIGLMAVGFASLIVVLEQGEQWEWFDSDAIRILSAVAAIGVVGCVARELTAARPFINLRVLRNPTTAGCCTVLAVLGGVALGSTYIIPLYCGEIQNYSPQQIGWVVMWAGLPQFLMFPLMPRMVRRFNRKGLVLIGILLFALSCGLNVSLTQDVGATQLILPQLLRGFGQPLFMGPLNQIIVSAVGRAEIADVSAISAMVRNLGGSIYIAGIATAVDRREQFHFSALAERVTRNNTLVQERLRMMTASHGGDRLRALADIAGGVRQQARLMSFSDTFALVGVSMLVSICALALVRNGASPPSPGAGRR